MFIAIYEMKAKLGKEKEFETEWRTLTDYIYKHAGSLGSRLHSTENPQVYIAYSQWPSRDVFEDESRERPSEMLACRDRMRSSLENMKTLYELEVLDDRLK